MSTTYRVESKTFFPKIKDAKTGKSRSCKVTVQTLYISESPIFDSGEHKIVCTRHGYTLHTKRHSWKKNWQTMTNDMVIGDYSRVCTMTRDEAIDFVAKRLGDEVRNVL